MRANEKETKCQPLARARHSELNLEKTFGRRPHPPRVQPHATAMTAVAGTTRPYIITIIWTTDAMGGTWPTPTGGKMDCLVVGRRRARTKYLPMLSDLFRRETSKCSEKKQKCSSVSELDRCRHPPRAYRCLVPASETVAGRRPTPALLPAQLQHRRGVGRLARRAAAALVSTVHPTL